MEGWSSASGSTNRGSDIEAAGFNVWHSRQYPGLVWFLTAMHKERGEIDNHFVAEMNGPDRPGQLYGLAVLPTAIAGMLVLMSEEPPEMLEQPEVLDGVPVLAADVRGVEPLRPPGALTAGAVQTVAVVGASVIAGAAALAIVHRCKSRRLARRRRLMLAPVLASRSFLVDVHVLGERK